MAGDRGSSQKGERLTSPILAINFREVCLTNSPKSFNLRAAMRRIGILLALLGLTLSVLAQTNTEVRTLSLEDCLQIALEHNLDVQIKRYNPEISRFTLFAAYGAYD